MNIRKGAVVTAAVLTLLAPATAALAAGGGAGGGGGTGADLQVTGSASLGSPGPTQTFWYTYQVKNNGTQMATGNVLTTTLPAGETLNWAQLQNYAFVINCTSSVNATGMTNLTCPLPDMMTGNQYNVLIDVNAPPVPGSVTDTATVASTNTVDPKPANNSFSVTVQVKSSACALPAGQPTLFGMIMSSGVNSFQYLAGGVTYTVTYNVTDVTRPLTSLVNMLCQAAPTTELIIGTNVYVTGIVDSVNDTISASVIQTLAFKDFGA